jgi:hypothetical protein
MIKVMTHSEVVAVGEGRGFVVQGKESYVITAAHCLPSLPSTDHRSL